jgi:2-C-methyl-D-erythritol 4-phosphate cytidylyltransferase
MQDSAAVVIVDCPDPARPSLWTPLAGRIILARTVDVFEDSPLIHSIILLLAAENIARADILCRDEGWRKIAAIIAGGTSRQASVRSSLDTLAEAAPGNDWVLIHDAARPLVPPSLLEAGLRAAQEYQAATAAVPVKETIKQVQHRQIAETLDRSQLWAVQTPQVFSYPLIHQAHEQVTAQDQQNVTDDAALLQHLGQRVVIFPGSYTNIKIMTAEDLLLAEALLQGSL